uniref:Uncharacterized protein n=1 Tax=Globisporangium ultimum (strain ATCC 200006 / CBS 805.95 / DAOM BR144) TaxID=431595 RepID=K3WKM7_GLOUD
MGNDGGVIAVKRKFMRHGNTKARSEKVSQEALRVQKAQTCAISEESLREPIVVCELGNLYNKQALLEHLLAKTMPEKFQHIMSLKDVVTCRFSKQKADSTSSNGASLFYCPVSMLEFNGKQPFVVVSTCGCVVSERSLKEVQTKECLVCGKSMDGAKLIALFLSDENYELKQKEILERKAQEKLLKKESKKNKSSKKNAADTADGATADAEENGEETAKKTKKDKKRKAEGQHSSAAHVPASKIVKDATSAIQKEKAKSAVFASLFSKDKSEKKSANDLLMTVGGMRYTLS